MTTPVAIALVEHNDCYLVGRCAPGAPLAGYFEFPGGKCHPHETLEACVVRECLEETGLVIEVIRLRRDLLHTYPYGTIHLHFFDCRLAAQHVGMPLRPGFVWVPRAGLVNLSFPEPNQALVTELVQEWSPGTHP